MRNINTINFVIQFGLHADADTLVDSSLDSMGNVLGSAICFA